MTWHQLDAYLADLILFLAAYAFFWAARVERAAARYDRKQARTDFETVQRALTLFNMGAKEEAAQVLGILGARPERRSTGTTASEFIASKSRIPPTPPNTSNRLL
jgi:hypothetical protein